MAIMWKNEELNPNDDKLLKVIFYRLYQLHKSAKGLGGKPIVQQRAYEMFYTCRQIVTPLIERFWITSYPVGTEGIPGIDERDVQDTMIALEESHNWEKVNWGVIRFQLARSVMQRGYGGVLPDFPGMPCKKCKGWTVVEGMDGQEPCTHCGETGVEPEPVS